MSPGRRGHAAAVQAVLLPRRHPEPRRARDARLDPRGRRARLLAEPTPTARRSTTPTWWCACVVGDGEAETGPLATGWHSQQVPQPGRRRRGAADPAPQRLQDRQPHRAGAHPRGRAGGLFAGYGYRPHFVEGDDPAAMHQRMAAAAGRGRSTRSPRSSRRARDGR